MTMVSSSTVKLSQSEAKTEPTIAHLRYFPIPQKQLIARHFVLSLSFVLLYLVLNLPQTIFISHLGYSAWYPANGLALALMLSISPWYALLVAFCDALAGALIYHQPLKSFGETLGSIGLAGSYGLAAYILRNVLPIDQRLDRGRDVVRDVFVVTAAALGSTVTGVACLIADHTITPHDFWPTLPHWFIGDEIG